MSLWYNAFRNRLAVAFGALWLVLGLGLFTYMYTVASERMSEASGEALTSIGKSVANVLAATLAEREREILLLSERPMFGAEKQDIPAIRRAIDQVWQSYRHYAWIGFADAGGIVRAAGGGLLEGADVSKRPWFVRGLEGPFVGDVHEAVLLAKQLQAPVSGEPLRFVDFAAPVRDRHRNIIGVVASHAHWAWVGEVLASSLPPDAERRGIEAFIAGASNDILHPYAAIGSVRIPAELPSDGKNAAIRWEGGESFLTSCVHVPTATSTDLGWKIVVRQPIAKALLPVAEMNRTLLGLGGAAALLCMLLAYRLASGMSRPVEALAAVAEGIQRGDDRFRFTVDSRLLEVRSLAASLQGMTETLFAQKQALEEINATLEEKVRERTAELEAANLELARISRRDALTGLHNRRSAAETLRAEFLRMKRTGGDYSVLMIDIDRFKQVNDRFGHEAGDAVLKSVAALVERSVRSTDFVARFGGEEFLVILPDTVEEAPSVAEKIRRSVGESDAPAVGRVTISLGVATASGEDACEDDAVRRADAALYRAKAEGRDRVCIAPTNERC